MIYSVLRSFGHPFLKKIFVALVFGNLFFSSASFSQAPTSSVDVVFCIDLSASTNGILDRFRDHLWDYVHLFDQCSPTAEFRIGFVAFSRPSYKRENSYVKVIRDLSSDFESLSHDLLQIKSTIEKGDQFVGAALSVCAKNISWSKDSNSLKVVFIIGNGKANTGEIHLEDATEELTSRGVIVNAIYCLEPAAAYDKRGWEKIAEAGNGKFSAIQVKNVYYESLHGFDIDKFHSLNRKFNDTYLYYGKSGFSKWKLQCMEDDQMYTRNTEGYRYRAEFKMSNRYQQKNSEWDLVDLHMKDPAFIFRADKLTMPDTMKNMSWEDLRAYVIFNKYQRKLLAKKMKQMLEEKSRKDIEEGRVIEKTMGTLDVISINILKDLMIQRGFELLENVPGDLKN
jgi:hypothetical protein